MGVIKQVKMKIQKIVSYIVLAVGILSGTLLYFMNTGISQLMFEKEASDPRELLVESTTADQVYSAVSPLYNLSVVVVVVLFVVTLITVFKSLASNPSSLKKTGIGVVVFLVIVGVSYALSEGQDFVTRDGDIISACTVKWVGAGIRTFYILSGTAIISMILAGVKKSISN